MHPAHLHAVSVHVDAQWPCHSNAAACCLCCCNLAVNHVCQHQLQHALDSESRLPASISCRSRHQRLLKKIEVGFDGRSQPSLDGALGTHRHSCVETIKGFNKWAMNASASPCTGVNWHETSTLKHTISRKALPIYMPICIYAVPCDYFSYIYI